MFIGKSIPSKREQAGEAVRLVPVRGGSIMHHRKHLVLKVLATAIVLGGSGISYGQSGDAVVFKRCRFLGNRAVTGGGVYAAGANVELVNSLFVGNAVTGAGGAVYSESTNLEVTNSTIVANSEVNDTAENAGGVYVVGSGSAAVRNSILWKNERDGASAATEAQINGTGVVVTYSCVQDADPDDGSVIAGAGNIDDDPLFTRDPRPWANGWDGVDDDLGSLTLEYDSPCRDEGDNLAVEGIATDLAGAPRVLRGVVDIGAYESGVVIHVDSRATGPFNGLSWDTAFADLQDALAVAESGTEIWVAEGVYTPGDAETDTFLIPPALDPYGHEIQSLGIYGGFSGGERSRGLRDPERHPTILSGDVTGDDAVECTHDSPDCDLYGGRCEDGVCRLPNPDNLVNNAHHVVTTDNATNEVILDGFVITGGYADGPGGEDQLGGGIRNSGGSPTIRNCRIEGNHAVSGGGIANHGPGAPSPHIEGCTLVGNVATESGGGIWAESANVSISRCRFLGNSAGVAGGGMSNTLGTTSIDNSIFVANDAVRGGAVQNTANDLSMVNCTVTANSGTTALGASSGGVLVAGSNPVTILTSILWNNVLDGVAEQAISQINDDGSANLTVDYSQNKRTIMPC